MNNNEQLSFQCSLMHVNYFNKTINNNKDVHNYSHIHTCIEISMLQNGAQPHYYYNVNVRNVTRFQNTSSGIQYISDAFIYEPILYQVQLRFY